MKSNYSCEERQKLFIKLNGAILAIMSLWLCFFLKVHTERISSGKCDVKLTVPYNSLLHKIDRIRNCVINISDSIAKREIFQELLVKSEE